MLKLASLVFIIAGIVMFLTLPAILITFVPGYFHNAFERYDVYSNFTGSGSLAQLNSKFGEVLTKLQPPFNTLLDSKFYSPEDRAHMHDVQTIYVYLYLAAGLALIIQIGITLLLLFITHGDETILLLKATQQTVGFVLISIIIGGAVSFVSWERAFTLFHEVLFPQNNFWQLDPATSNLIKFLPASIFQELLLIYLACLGIQYVLWKLGVAMVTRRYT